jgi:hypothetical protein
MVLQPGVEGASGFGHVAVVASNGPTFSVTQMDVPVGNSNPSSGTFHEGNGVGFIYPPGGSGMTISAELKQGLAVVASLAGLDRERAEDAAAAGSIGDDGSGYIDVVQSIAGSEEATNHRNALAQVPNLIAQVAQLQSELATLQAQVAAMQPSAGVTLQQVRDEIAASRITPG